ncbi:MAG TPA: hypothetical protein VG734_01550 [Lacunisphaera sp.]|nr:hypothetical protein [Lacunisphaera sp.]
MIRKISTPSPSASLNAMTSSLTMPHFVRRFTTAASIRARFGTNSASTLWTPNLVDSLRAPLTRFRD